MSMTRAQVTQKVREVLAKQQDLTLDKVKPSSRLQEDLGVESFDAVELMFEFENMFNVVIPDEAIPGMRTIKDIVDYVLKQMQQPQEKAKIKTDEPTTLPEKV